MKKRLLVALAIMAVCLGVSTRTALADVVWQSKTSDHYMAAVYPVPYGTENSKKYVLAEYAGYNYGSWSTTTRQAIEQGQGGNNPWTRAIAKVYNRAYDYGGGGGGHGFGDGFELPFSNQIDIVAVLWGDDFVWDVDMTKADYDQLRAYIAYWALPRFSGKPDDDVEYVWLSTRFSPNAGATYYCVTDDTTYTSFDKPVYVKIKKQSYDELLNITNNGENPIWYIWVPDIPNGGFTNKELVSTFASQVTTSGDSFTTIRNANGKRCNGSTGVGYLRKADDYYYVDFGGFASLSFAGILSRHTYTPNGIIAGYDIAGEQPYAPTPDPPQPPVDVPEPQEPEPYTPDEPEPYTPEEPSPVVGTDITDYLQAILDDMAAHCTHIRDEIAADLAEHCNHIQQALQNLETGINGYLYELSEFWNEKLPTMIKDGLSDVVHWLKLIYGRILSLATGRPAVDDDGGFDFFQWLTSLVTGFLGGLLGGLAALVSGLGQDASKLITKFPFSLPWDLYGILLLFEAIPQTPVVTLDWPLFNGETFHYVLDFTPWNDMMAICRDVERIVFAGMLIKLTPKFLGESEV